MINIARPENLRGYSENIRIRYSENMSMWTDFIFLKDDIVFVKGAD